MRYCALGAPGAAAVCTATCLYPAGISKCEGSTGADEKLEVVIWVSIRMAPVGWAGVELEFGSEFWAEFWSGGGSCDFFLPNPKPPRRLEIMDPTPALATWPAVGAAGLLSGGKGASDAAGRG